MAKDIYHSFKVEGNNKNGFYIAVTNNSDNKLLGFVGSKNNVRMFKREDLATRHRVRLESGLSKLTIA